MDPEFLSSIITKFAVKFCNELEKNRNMVCSPLSAEMTLALLTLGATDPAHSELLTSLGFADDDSIRSSFSVLTSKLKGQEEVILKAANKIYIRDDGYELQPQLEKDAIEIFDAAMEKVDFNDSAVAVNNINTWVQSKTDNKIKDIISKDDIDRDTCLVIVNAIYFKGAWDNPFSPSNTKDLPFHIDANTTVQVPMMHHPEDKYFLSRSDSLQAELLWLPYIDKKTKMVIILPREIEGLNEMLAKLAAGYDLNSDMEKRWRYLGTITIPKFKIETEINLNELLPKLGVHAIFNRNNTGLTKLINCDETLYVSGAIQKAVIEVNEQGTEAADSFSSMFMKMCYCPPYTFYADRPFLYLLLSDGGIPLFIGTYRGIA